MCVNKQLFRRGLALIISAALAFSLAGCSMPELKETAMGLMERVNGPIRPEKLLSDSSWRNSDIDGAVTGDMDIRLQDDFHAAVNQSWLLDAQIPESGTASRFVELNTEMTDQFLSMFQPGDNTCDEEILPQDEADHLRELLLNMTALAMDWDSRNALGAEPLRPFLEAIESISSLEELTAYLCGEGGTRLLEENLINAAVKTPISSRDCYTVHLSGVNHLFLVEPSEYRSITSTGSRLLDTQRDTVRAVLERLGYTRKEADQLLNRCLWLEVSLVKNLPTSSEFNSGRYPEHADNLYTWEQLAERQGNFPLTRLLEGQGLDGSDSYLLYEPLYLDTLSGLYTEGRVEDFKAYLIVHTVLDSLSLLDKECVALSDEISAVLQGISLKQQEKTSDEEEPLPPIPTDSQPEDAAQNGELETAVATYVSPYLMEASQELYVARFCTAQQKRELTVLVEEIVEVYEEMLKGEDWLSEQAREKAIEKLGAIEVRVLYPDKLTDYSGLNILPYEEGGSLPAAVAAVRRFHSANAGEKVNQPIERDAWDMVQIPTMQVNACYVPADNTINIQAGILVGGAMYDTDAPREQNLAMLGMIVGHEISHAFDTTGYLFDKDGLLNTWWTSDDEVAFRLRADRLANHYSALSVLPNVTGGYDGTKIQGEAIADMGGLKCMLLLAEKEPDFDYELFFKSYASLWRCKTDYINEMKSTEDEHPLNFLRTNVTLQQFEKFYETFDIGPGDGMYLAPEDRIPVW